ncbi:MAG: EAL domain-containing protein [Eubacteriales bacterium]|nr:EAL domain-containing protein [Eubacteriales bacterium]
MNKIIKNEFGLSKKDKTALAMGMLIFFSLSLFIYFGLYKVITELVKNQSVKNIVNISELNEDSVSRAIANRKTLLESFSINIARRKMDNKEAILNEMATYAQTYEFYNMGILTEDFMLHLTTGDVIDVKGKKQFEDAWSDDFCVSESYASSPEKEYMINMFSYPVQFDGKIQYVITAAYGSVNLTKRMNIKSMNGKGYNFLLDSNGNVVISSPSYENEAYIKLMKYLNASSEILPKEGKEAHFSYEGEKYYAHIEKMEINDWYLMTCAREKDVFADANKILCVVFIGMGMLWMMILLALSSTMLSIYKSKEELRNEVFYDHLLHIGNGEYLNVFFRELSKKKRDKMAFLIFDVDKFKEFNYIYGEDEGDNLLRYIAEVFKEEMPNDYLFRYLADHFVALVHCESKEDLTQKLDGVLRRFSSDIEKGRIQPFDVSAGIRKLHRGDPLRRVMSDALIAKGTVKGIQLQQYAFYDESIRDRRMNYMEMESDFARALRENEFQVYYQPKYHMETGEILGAEALVRWVKQDGTIVSPGAFIPCFEASRQIVLLDEAMLESVCRQMKEMEEEGLEIKNVSVNLSRVHLRHQGILSKIERIVRNSGIDPTKLSFEITESALYEDSIPLKRIVDFMHDLGCGVDMDDYGMGVSSPNALVSNRFDLIKLDKTFIDGIGDERMEAVIRSTITLSRDLGMDILAEGVEEKYQVDSLVRWGCVLAQGYYFSPPVPEKKYREMLKRHSF